MFDPSHARKRAPGAGDRHPVVYVSSVGGDEILPMAERAGTQALSPARRKRNGNMPRAEPTAANIRGATRKDAAIWQILPIAIPSSPGAIAKSTTVSRRVRRSGRSPSARVRSGWKTWPATSGNGAAIFSSLTKAPRKRIRAAQNPARKRVYRGGSWKSRFQQPARDDPRLERAELFLQRSRVPDRLRMRIVG